MSEQRSNKTEVRVNVLALSVVGGIVVGGLSLFLEPSDVAMLGASYIGAIGATLSKLTEPPAPEPPPTIEQRLADVLEKAISNG